MGTTKQENESKNSILSTKKNDSENETPPKGKITPKAVNTVSAEGENLTKESNINDRLNIPPPLQPFSLDPTNSETKSKLNLSIASMKPTQINTTSVPNAVASSSSMKHKRPYPDTPNITLMKQSTHSSGKKSIMTPNGPLKKKNKLTAGQEGSTYDHKSKKNGLYSSPWLTSATPGTKMFTKEITKNTTKKNNNVNGNTNLYKIDGINEKNSDVINTNIMLPGTNGIHGMHMNNGYNGVGPGQIADPTVVKAVHDILALLQVYGPLTHDQLEYNLPPMHPSNKLQQILDILMVTKIINIVDDSVEHKSEDNPLNRSSEDNKEKVNESQVNKNHEKDKPNEVQIDEKKDMNRSSSLNEAASQDHATPSKTLSKGMMVKPQITQFQKPPRYMFLHGETRAPGDAIHIHDLFSSLEAAKQEIIDSQTRIQILQEALNENYLPIDKFSDLYPHPIRGDDEIIIKDNQDGAHSKSTSETKKKKSGREILLSIADQYPEIVEDQVYATALKNFNC